MKTKITACIVVALLLMSGMSQAQQRQRAEKMQKAMIKLTDEQKEELKAAKIEYSKATIDVKNELNELQAYQRTLMSAEKLNEKEVYKNIDKMTALKKQLMEERINMRLSTSGILDEEQKMQRDMKMKHRKMKAKHMIHRKGDLQRGQKGQFADRRKQRAENYLGLSDTQKEQMKNLKLEHKKATQNLREEVKELLLKQKHLLNDEKPDKEAIYSNIDRISTIQNQLAKERVVSQKEIRNILDEEQLVLFLSRPNKMNKHRKARMQRAF